MFIIDIRYLVAKLSDETIIKEQDDKYLFLIPSKPDWIVTNKNGALALSLCNGRNTLDDICRLLADHPNPGEKILLIDTLRLQGFFNPKHIDEVSIENSCHYMLDWNFDEDRCRISKGYGPENITRLRRFAIGLLKSKGIRNVTQKMRQLSFCPRLVFDYLRIPANNHSFSVVQG